MSQQLSWIERPPPKRQVGGSNPLWDAKKKAPLRVLFSMINDIRSLNGRNPSLMDEITCDEIRFADYFLSYKKAESTKMCFLLFGGAQGTCRLLRLRLAHYWLGDRCFATVPASPLFAKNSSPNCFLNAQTLSGSNPLFII